MKVPDLEQKDRQELILKKIGKEDWLEVYRFESGANSVTFWCALVESSKVAKQLERTDWEFYIGYGRPGHIVYGFDEKRVEYFRYGNDDGFQPLVYPRSFGKKKRSYIELSEEFRLLHDLYATPDESRLVKLHDSGMEEDVVLVNNDAVAVKLRFLRQFLAVKDMHLAVFFEMNRDGDRVLDDGELKQIAKSVKTENVRYDVWAWNWDFPMDAHGPSGSRILGKKFIPPFAKSECGVFPYSERNPQYAEFVIRIDDDGKQVMSTCDQRKLADYFGKNAGAPDFLTPVYFRREVLQKYYAKAEMYSVEAGYVRCGGQWGIPIDDEHRDHVVVALGDLGKCLPHDEQLYWKSYNVPPDGGYSRGWYQRNMLGMWVATTHPEFVFKSRFERFQEPWEKKFGWPLFRPLRDDDKHLLATLRIPLNDEQAEFDAQVLALAKLMVDSLNEAEISKLLPNKIDDEKGIAKFERFLKLNGVGAAEAICTYLRRLYGLRHGAGHRKGDSYEKAAEFFGVGKQPLKEVFVEILVMATELLQTLDRKFIGTKED
jgi:hypothetical protein